MSHKSIEIFPEADIEKEQWYRSTEWDKNASLSYQLCDLC